ncbi:MAG: VOC family protein [Actinomycetota bacterium]|nr:VOC family protein [Actinomycetota bacterium]
MSADNEPPTIVFGLDHIVLVVADVEASVDWYREHLGLVAERLDQWRVGAVPFVSLRVDSSTVLDLVQRDVAKHGDPGSSAKEDAVDRVNVDHAAFVTDRTGFDAFCARHRELIEMGPKPLFGARGMGDGVYVRDPDGHRVEVRTYE